MMIMKNNLAGKLLYVVFVLWKINTIFEKIYFYKFQRYSFGKYFIQLIVSQIRIVDLIYELKKKL